MADRSKAAPLSYELPPDSTPKPRRYFIADLHLDGLDTGRALRFRAFLNRLAAEAAIHAVELYIVGDLFEFWYEYRKALFELYRADLDALETAWKAGVHIYLFFGNRDFAYGRYVTRRFGATVLGDGQDITLNDSRRVWLEHGDLLCTADHKYLRFRKMIRSWPVRMIFWMLPWSVARKSIDRIRTKSNSDMALKPAHTLEIDLHAARRRLEAMGCRILICGHIHQPKSEDLGAGYRLIVLPPWCENAAGYMDDGNTLKPFTA